MLIKEMMDEEKPRERLLKYGVKNLSNEELISIILRTGTKNISVKELSNQILLKLNNLSDLNNITIHDLISIKGLKEVKAITLISAIELGKRVNGSNVIKPKIVINTSNVAYEVFKDLINIKNQEQFLAVYLDTKKRLISYEILFKGTVDYSLIHPRDVFREAYKVSASSIIIMHNHPSGEIIPSKDDLEITKNLVQISKTMGIPIIDHLIIGNNKYFSFLEHDKLD